MEISNIPEKEFKVLFIHTRCEKKSWWTQQELQQRERKYNKEPVKADKLNNLN